MDNTQRLALEQEFDTLSARLGEMMEQLPAMQPLFTKWAAALRANAAMETLRALREENEEVERVQGHVQKAIDEHKQALRSRENLLADAAKEAVSAQRLALDHALSLQKAAKDKYEASLNANGFADEEALKAAFLPKPEFDQLEETVKPFRTTYLELLVRCEEIERLLSEDEQDRQ